MKETKMSAEKVVKEPKPKLMNIKLGMWWTGMWTKVSRVPPPQNALNLCAAQRERDRYRYKVMTKLNITVVSANTLVSVPGEDDLELLDVGGSGIRAFCVFLFGVGIRIALHFGVLRITRL